MPVAGKKKGEGVGGHARAREQSRGGSSDDTAIDGTESRSCPPSQAKERKGRGKEGGRGGMSKNHPIPPSFRTMFVRIKLCDLPSLAAPKSMVVCPD